MAHHVAELITAANEAKNKAEQAVAEERAVETILKLWEHRTALPGQAYPLAQFKEILELLSKLTPDANPWHRQARGERQQLSLDIFSDLTHLTNLLLSLEAKSPHFSSARTSKLLGSLLPAEEANVYLRLTRMVGLEANASEPEPSAGKGDEEDTPAVAELRRTIAGTQKHLSSLLRVLDHRAGSDINVQEDAAVEE
jgi:hypothetical protein